MPKLFKLVRTSIYFLDRLKSSESLNASKENFKLALTGVGGESKGPVMLYLAET